MMAKKLNVIKCSGKPGIFQDTAIKELICLV